MYAIIERVFPDDLLQGLPGLVEFPERDKQIALREPCSEVSRPELDRAFEIILGTIPVSVKTQFVISNREIDLGQGIIEFQCPLGRLTRKCQILGRIVRRLPCVICLRTG